MTTPDPREARLRARLSAYGAGLDEAGAAPPAAKPRRHLVVVDGPVGGGGTRRRPPWRGPVGRAAAVLVVLAALAGATWAATRPTPSTTTATGRGWADEDIVRPEDRPSAFAALEGTWPLPPDGSLRYVLDQPTDASTTFAAFRQALAHGASCLWFRHVVEDPDLSVAHREVIAAMPSWPGIDDPADASSGSDVRDVAGAALAGDVGRLRRHLTTSCRGTAAGLGLPDLDGRWLSAGGAPTASGSAPPGSAAAIDPTRIRGWDAIVGRLGPAFRVEGAIGFVGGGHNVALSGPGGASSLTIEVLRGPVTLPITDAVFDRGSAVRADGREVYVGPIGDDDATLAQVVGPDGASISLSFAIGPERVEELLADLADLALDLHAAAWPR